MTRSRAYLPLSQNFGGRSVGFSRSTYAHFPVVKGLVSYWPFIEGAGNTVKDYWGSNNGTLNQTDHWSTGRFGNAYDFDGTDDYVTVPQGFSYDEFSVALWLKADGPIPDESIIITNGWVSWGLDLRPDGLGLWFFLDDDGAWGPDVILTLITPPSAGVWYHAAMTYSKSGGKVKGYLNGKLVNTANWAGSPFAQAALYIGYENAFNRYHFDGIIDEVCIWNRALKRSEIVSMMWRRREG